MKHCPFGFANFDNTKFDKLGYLNTSFGKLGFVNTIFVRSSVVAVQSEFCRSMLSKIPSAI